MDVQNSIIIADFMFGVYNPLYIISVVDLISVVYMCVHRGIKVSDGHETFFEHGKAFFILSGIYLIFSLWFFNTFRLV